MKEKNTFKKPFMTYAQQIDKLKNDKKLKIIQKSQLYKHMGFPNNWEDIKEIRK